MPALTRNSAFVQPKNENSFVWKYLSFDKFMYILNSNMLPLVRIDKFNDEFEGKIDTAAFKKSGLKEILDLIKQPKARNTRINPFYINRLMNFASCWCIDENESDALWKIFAGGENSLAIKTKYKILKKMLPNTVYIGAVTYSNNYFKDFDEDRLKNMHTFIMTK